MFLFISSLNKGCSKRNTSWMELLNHITFAFHARILEESLKETKGRKNFEKKKEKNILDKPQLNPSLSSPPPFIWLSAVTKQCKSCRSTRSNRGATFDLLTTQCNMLCLFSLKNCNLVIERKQTSFEVKGAEWSYLYYPSRLGLIPT